MNTQFAIIDIETTGLRAGQDRIIEIGIVLIQNNQIIDRFQSLVNPQVRIPHFIQNHTGITNQMVIDQPTINEIIPHVFHFTKKTQLVAHNASFDSRFLNIEFKKLFNQSFPFLCTLLLSKRIFPNLSNYKLETLVEIFNLPKGNAHRALSDAEMTSHLLFQIKKNILSHSTINFTATNLSKIQKVPPIFFRKNGIQKGIEESKNK